MKYVQIPISDGQSMKALSVSTTVPNAPGIVLVQEIFGINSAMQTLAKKWAEKGFNVLCPDLFWRQEPDLQLDPTKQAQFDLGVELMQGMDDAETVADLESTRAFLAKQLGHDKIAAVGYCMGGRLVVLMAGNSPIKCAVSYYGVGLQNLLPSLTKDAAPTLLHIAELDSYVPTDVRKVITDDADQRTDWEHYLYRDCDHAFARPNGTNYVEEAANEANKRSVGFLNRFLA
ncbi:dienelactone hydrolase family protein [Paenalcaligenes niemegkensis]|uniref:dienelactone hydrolase family protein n=1 Tax=Paenalcaligenes niemegkensis TaxID=2895469 RepID=UPI001EE7E4C4|nr:dienelactone hydrolase family protein [Paenalcaligenes niemegkensis]MCQ9618319.1 dienelactone hydrolase family protein [Paenalcaligenes niemegkensis]